MDNNLNKNNKKINYLGILSLITGILPICFFIIITIIDVLFPLATTPEIALPKNTLILMNICFLINMGGIVLGSISLIKNAHKNSLALWGIIINAFIPILSLISVLKRLL